MGKRIRPIRRMPPSALSEINNPHLSLKGNSARQQHSAAQLFPPPSSIATFFVAYTQSFFHVTDHLAMTIGTKEASHWLYYSNGKTFRHTGNGDRRCDADIAGVCARPYVKAQKNDDRPACP